jgi:2-polyprenyl-3-methyl-5-hydroxy-6-metoxy-1,4-benzoquinol methylase
MEKQDYYKEIKSFWNKKPCNINHSNKEVGTKGYFDDLKNKKYFVEPHIPAFADFEKWSGKKVLEIGCGLGTDTMSFAMAGANVTAIDLSDQSMALAKKRAKIYGVSDKVRFINANCEDIDKLISPDEKFDLIYSFGVLHHVVSPEIVLKKIQNYMKEDTVLKVMLYSRYSVKYLNILLGFDRFQSQAGSFHMKSYSFKQIKKLFKDYDIEEIRKDHIFTWKIPPYLKHEYKKKFIWKIMPKFMFRFMEHQLGWHTLITAKKK